MSNLKYMNKEYVYRHDAHLAFETRFQSKKEFDAFYNSLIDDEVKNNFLRVGTTYLFFVKNADWKINVPRSNASIAYITNSFKLVALMALIESLSSEKFEDFFQWIIKKPSNFPIADKKELENLYHKYKNDYGSIKKCKAFFSALPRQIQDELCKSVTLEGNPLESIELFVSLLYRARSKFAHEVGTTSIFSGNHLAKYSNKTVCWKLTIDRLLEIFEIGVISYFSPSILKARPSS